MTPFKRRRRGGLVSTFDPAEAAVLANLAGQVVELLRDRNGEKASDPDPLMADLGFTGPAQAPEDPVLRRLLPDAYRDEPEDAAEFRRFTEPALTSAKVGNAQQLIDSLAAAGLDPAGEGDEPIEVELGPEAAQAWLRSLTDIRLSLAVRLGIETEEDAMLLAQSGDEAEMAMSELYDWLGYVQETLVQALS
jgi:hypothetical protein